MKALADAAAPSLKKARKGRAQLADPQHASDGSFDTAKGAPLSVALPEQAAGAPGRMDIIGSPWYGRTDAGRAGASCGHARGVGLCLRRGSWSPATTRAGHGFRMPAECRQARAAGPEAAAKRIGLEVKFGTVASVNDIEQVLTSISDDVEAIYLPTDNTFASAMANVAKVTEAKKLPVIAGAQSMVEEGGLATIGLDYYKLGLQTGAMAAKILNGESEPATTPVETLQDTDLMINFDTAKAIGYTFPPEILAEATIRIGKE